MSTTRQPRWLVPSSRPMGTLTASNLRRTPSASSARSPCGWMSSPAPKGSSVGCFSKTSTRWPKPASAMEVARPAGPAPAIPMFSFLCSGCMRRRCDAPAYQQQLRESTPHRESSPAATIPARMEVPTMPRVAIIGAGPGGLVAARYLQSEGFEPVLFEQAQRPGGQWSGDPICSGVWPSMRTNTSRVLTQFSDLPHAPGLAVYPSNREIGDYLLRYANRFDLSRRIRLRTKVHEIAPVPGGWAVRHDAHDAEIFDRVVVACGRFQHSRIPEVP